MLKKPAKSLLKRNGFSSLFKLQPPEAKHIQELVALCFATASIAKVGYQD
jgi:hypothetical protein